MEFSFSGRGPREMNFAAMNVAETWRKWGQSMQLYINATMAKKTEKEIYSFFLFLIGETRQEIFNTWVWPKVVGDDGELTDDDEITIAALFKKFEDYCNPKRNLIVERHKFNTRRQNLGQLNLITSQLVAGIQSDKVRDRLLREGSDLTLEKTINICRSHEVTQQQMKLFHGELEVDAVHKRQSDQNKRIKQRYIASDRSSKFTSSSKQDQEGKTEIRNLIAGRSCGRNHEV